MNIPLTYKISPFFKAMLFLGMILVSDIAYSTHIVGGDLAYRHLRDDIFEIILTIRRDCINGADDAQFDDPAMLTIYTGDGRLATWTGRFGFLDIPFNTDDTLNTTIITDCQFMGQQVCVQESKYVMEVRLPYRVAGYHITYQRCCRNITLNNVIDPTNTGSTYTTFISGEALKSGNSTPTFDQWGDIYICANEQLAFDHSATDIDGDSLVYKLCTPFMGATDMFPKPDTAPAPPYQPVVWFPPYNTENPMGGTPLKIDSETGLLTAVPNTVGQFLVGLCVEEYRDGKLLSTLRRDFEYNVRICTEDPGVSFEAESPICNDYTTTFNNTSEDINNFQWYFDYPNEDPQFTSTEVNPTFTFPEAGTYLVLLQGVRDSDGCSLSFSREITVLDNVIEVDFSAELTSCGDNIYSVLLTDNSSDTTDPNNTPISWDWVVATDSGDFTGSGQSTTIEFEGIMGEISLIVTTENGCINSRIQDFTISDLLPVPGFNATITSCQEDGSYTLNLTDNSENQSDITSFNWTIDNEGDISQLSGPSVDINVNGNEELAISYSITYNNGCNSVLDTVLNVNLLIPSAGISESITCNSDGTINLELSSTSNLSEMIVATHWVVNVDGVESQYDNDQVNIDDLSLGAEVFVSLQLEFTTGCIATAEKTFTASDLLPKVDFTSEVTSCNTDGTVDVVLVNISEDPGNTTSVEWEVVIGSTSQSYTTNEVSLTSLNLDDVIQVTLTVAYDNNCEVTTIRSINVSDILPEAIVVAEVSTCNDDNTVNVILSNGYTSSSGIATINWSIDLGTEIQTSDLETVVVENINSDQILVVTLDVVYNNGCSASAVTEINVADILPVASYSADITECKEDGSYEVTITDTSGNTSEVNWSIAINGSSQDYTGSPIVIIVTQDDEVNITQSVEFNNGCDDQKESLLDIASLLPIADFTTSIGSCNQDGTVNIILTPTSSDKNVVTDFNWTVAIDGITTTYTGSQVSLEEVSTTSEVTIILDLIFNTGCSASAEKNIVVADLLPQADFSIEVSSCNNDGTVDVDIKNTSDNVDGTTISEWVISIDGDSQTYSGSEISISGIDAGTVIEIMLTVTYDNSCDAIISRTIDTKDILPKAIVDAVVDTCNEDNTVNITLSNGYTASSGISSIIWTVDLGTEVITSDQETVELENVDIEQIIVVTLDVDYNNGCSASTTREIEVADILPTAEYNAEITECKDDGTYEVTITDTSGNTSEVSWSISINGDSQDYSGTPIVLILNQDDEVTVVQSVGFNNGCDAQEESEINISDLLPVADFTASVGSCNEDGTIDITLTSASPDEDKVTGYNWTVTLDGNTSTFTENEVVLTDVSTSSELNVVLDLEFSTSCNASEEKDIDIEGLLPKADFTPEVTSCNPDGTVDLTLRNTSDDVENITSSEWEITIDGNTESYTGNEITIAGLDVETIVDVQLTVTYDNNCDASITETVDVSKILLEAIVDALVDTCNEDNTVNITLSNGYTASSGISSISWSVDLGTEVITSDQETVELENVDVAQIIVVTLDVVYNNGCSASTTREIEVADILPSAEYNAEITECKDDGTYEVTITDTSGNTSEVSWSISINGVAQDYSGTPIVLILNQDDEVTVVQSVGFNNGCDAQEENEINISDLLPVADFTASVGSCNEDGTIDITLTSASPDEDKVTGYNWTVTLDGNTSTFTENEVVLTDVSTSSELNVVLDLEFSTSCNASVEKDIDIEDLLPKADFTPEVTSCNLDGTVDLTLRNTSDDVENITSSEWEITIDGNTESYTGNEITIAGLDVETIVDVQLTVTYDNNCDASITETVNVKDVLPTAIIDANVNACNEDNTADVILTNGYVSSSGIASIKWMVDLGTEVLNSDQEIFEIENIDINQTIVVSLDVVYNNGCSASEVKEINISDILPTAEYTAEVTECKEDGTFEVTINDTSGNTSEVNWSIAINGESQDYTESPIVLVLDQEDVLTIVQTVDFDNGCSDITESTINISDLIPNAGINAEISSCNEDGTADLKLTYTSNASDINTINWMITIDGATTSYSDEEVLLEGLSLDSEVQVTLDLEFSSGCSASDDQSFVLSDLLPTASYEADLISCVDENNLIVELSESSGMETTSIEWSIESNGVQTTGSDNTITLEIDRNNPTLVTLDVTFATGCTASLSDTLDIDNLLPIPEYSFSIDECDSLDSVTVTISDATDIDENIVTWNWDIIYDGQSFNYTTPSFTISLLRDSIIDISLMLGLDNGCVLILENDSFVPPLPEVTFTSDEVTGCLGDTVKLIANPDPSLTYVWSPEEGLIFDNPNDKSNPSVIVGDAMTYSVTISDGICEASDSVSVTIDPNTSIQIMGDTTTCDGMVSLIASGGKGGGTYQWSTSSDFQDIIFEGDTLNYTLDSRNETFWVRIVNSACNAEPVSHSVKNATPELAYLNPYEICRGDTLNYTVLNLDPDQVFTFEFEDNDHIISGQNTNSPEIGIGIEEMDSFFLVFSAINQYGCQLEDSVMVRIIDNPEISFDAVIEECGEYTVCFEITSDFNGTPLWEFGDPESGFLNASIDEQPCHTYPGPGDYVVTLSTLSNYCAAAADQQTITLTEDFTVDAVADQIICPGDTVNLSASATVDGLNYVWCTSDGDTLAIGEELTYIADTNDVQVLLKGFDFFGCSDTSSFLIDVFNFDLQIDIPEILCNGEETQISVTNSTGGDLQYMWGPEDAIVSGEETANPIISITETTELTLTVFESSVGCIIDTSFTVMASSISASITADPGNEINEGEEVVLDVNSDANIVDYEWSDPTINGNPVTVSPTENTTYTVTVTDDNGCTATASIEISVRQAVCDESDVFIPNAFTPNNDGNNDVFRVRSNFIEEMEMIVYNRWGQEIFRSTNQDSGWDGTFNGDNLSPDVYGYRLEVLCINDVRYITKGNVTLLR